MEPSSSEAAFSSVAESALELCLSITYSGSIDFDSAEP